MEFDSITKVELTELARDNGIVPGSKNKRELFEAIVRKQKSDKSKWRKGAVVSTAAALLAAYGALKYKNKYDALTEKNKQLSTNIDSQVKQLRQVSERYKQLMTTRTRNDDAAEEIRDILKVARKIQQNNVRLENQNKRLYNANKLLAKDNKRANKIIKDNALRDFSEYDSQLVEVARKTDKFIKTATSKLPPKLFPKPKLNKS